MFATRHHPRRTGLTLSLLVAAVLLGACSAIASLSEPERELDFSGPEDGALLNADDVEALRIEVEASWDVDDPGDVEEPLDLADLRVLLDGEDRTGDAEVDGTRLVWAPTGLEDGERTITIVSQPVPDPDADAAEDDGEPAEPEEPEVLREWTVLVDATPPDIELTSPDGAVVAGEELTVAGITEPGATVTIGDRETTADDDGGFELVLPEAPDGSLEIVAVDEAGNSSDDEVTLVTVPSRVESDEIRTVHVSFCAWVTPSLREPILDKIDRGLINAVQLDLKDETGKIGHDTEVEFAATIGADQPDCRVDLEAAVELLHGLDVPVIGRIVAFADPVLASWAWENGERDMVMQTEAGDKYVGRYAGFSNFAHPEVVEYNIALAEEAAAYGVDHILWDYIRKPDGTDARFPGLEGDPQDAILEFTRLADERIAPYGAIHGASVYGVSADRPSEVAQNIPAMAEHLDYVAPMLYPSHWGPGEYDVADPLNQPYDMINNALEVWLEAVDGTRARVVPWLEDSNWPVRLGYPDRASYVQEQIRATYDHDIDEWMLWDSAVRYTESGIIQPNG